MALVLGSNSVQVRVKGPTGGPNVQTLDLVLLAGCIDADLDGYDICPATDPGDTDALPADCNDLDPSENPAVAEICDGFDNNCGGGVDEGFLDTDGDGQADCVDPDDDDDNKLDGADNCPLVPNNNQADSDVPPDGVGDACDCVVDADCDDGNPCTADFCDPALGCQQPAGNVGAVCRPGFDVCDAAEVCDGLSEACPADVFEPPTTECRGTADVCDAAEFCSGTAVTCPADLLEPTTTECRPAGGLCDVGEFCDGVSMICPADVVQGAGTECRASAGVCDLAEVCDGIGAFCPADGRLPDGTVCRAAAGVCDLDELCDGASPLCAPDAKQPATFECRASAGACDLAELCDGTGDICPGDAFETAGVVCRPAAGICDVDEQCDGASPLCAADAKQPATFECRGSAGTCDPVELCDGTGDICPGDAFETAGVVCRAAAGICDVEEQCDGASPLCAADAKQPATFECRGAAGACDLAELCDGTGDLCPGDLLETAGTTCRAAAGVCDVDEQCDGASPLCAADAKQPATFECRASAGACDVAELCDGTGDLCPGDLLEPTGTTCRPPAVACDATEVCDGGTSACPVDASEPDGSFCSLPNASAECASGTCSPTSCDAGFEDCDLDPANGCEVGLDNDAANCGACGNACSSGESCLLGVCQDSIVQVSSGFSHTCAVRTSGEVLCWGNNFKGQLGNGQVGESTGTPVGVDLGGTTEAVSAGGFHTCAVRTSGEVLCWGDNGMGQLGNPAAVGSSPTPVTVDLGGPAQAVSAGYAHTCAVRTSGEVLCWGGNWAGQLGNNSAPESTPTPVMVVAQEGAAQAVSAGTAHTCALLTGEVFCWGQNSHGQLGLEVVGFIWSHPTAPVDLGQAAQVVSAGSEHTCAVRVGQVRCWGSNFKGQLGNGQVGGSTGTPVGVDLNGAAQGVSAGGDHTCAVQASGEVRCWGNNLNGQLGNGQVGGSIGTPVGVDLNGAAQGVSAGAGHTCTVRTTGDVLCWGNNDHGQLGNGAVGGNSPTPLAVVGLLTCPAGFADCDLDPSNGCEVSITTLSDCGACGAVCDLGDASESCLAGVCALDVCDPGFANCDFNPANGCEAALTTLTDCGGCGLACDLANASESCATGACEIVACDPSFGDCDGDTATGCETNLDTDLTHCGACDAVCELANASESCVTGTCTLGVCGTGFDDCDVDPVTGCEAEFDTDPANCGACGTACAAGESCVSGACQDSVVQTSAGADHTCAVRGSGGVVCWGSNWAGQLGDGTTTASSVPVPVPGLSDAIQVAAGDGYTCAVHGSGAVSCWGSNFAGQLGDGTTTDSSSPVAVIGLAGAVQVATHQSHSCTVLATGQVFCWGAGGAGELGNGTNTGSTVPVGVGLNQTDAVQVSVGEEYSCAVHSTSRVSCWGANGAGQLGDGTQTDSNWPVTVVDHEIPIAAGPLTDAVAVSAAVETTCATMASGDVHCWGSGGPSGLWWPATSWAEQVWWLTPAFLGFDVVQLEISLFTDFGCLLSSDAEVGCWDSPGNVVGLLAGAVQFSAGGGHACALRSDAQVLCWGANTWGQLGDGTTNSSSTPVAVVGLYN